MEPVIQKFVTKYDDSQTPTHTLLNGGKIHVPKEQLDKFYSKLVKRSFEDNETIQLVERIGEIHPFLVDLDLKYKDVLTGRQYTHTTLKEIATYLWKTLNNYLKLEAKDSECWIMEKDTPYPCSHNDFEYKDGIHIVFPEIILKRDTYKYIIKQIQTEDTILTIFTETCDISPDNDTKGIIDASFSSWQPYGCRKQGETPYRITCVFEQDSDDSEMEPVSEEDFESFYSDCNENNLDIAKRMCVQHHDTESVSYNPELIQALDKPLKTSSTILTNMTEPDPYVYGVDEDEDRIQYRLEGEELKYVRELVKCLCVERAEAYDDWLRCGLLLHNINESLLDAWKSFSSQASNYSEPTCDDKWNSFDNGYSGPKLGLGSLKIWAKKDNPLKYIEVQRNNVAPLVHEAVRLGSDADYLVAKVIQEYYKNEFICVDAGEEWFHFNGSRWERTLKANVLQRRIPEEVYRIFENRYNHYSNLCAQDPNSEDPKKWLKNLFSIQMKLLKGSYQKTLLSHLQTLFYVKDVMTLFDSNLSILGFDNGVYDLRDKEFRIGRPEDYLTMSTGLSFPVEASKLPMKLDGLSKHVKSVLPQYDRLEMDLQDFLCKIIPQQVVREYTMLFLSKCLSGENRDEGFYIWTGSGGNGKSKLIDLMSQCLGQYFCNLPVALLTQKRKASGAASPEMALTLGKRLAVMQEPDVNETLNVGEMKEITGNDKIQARGLYKEPFEFTPQFKLLMMCNDLPNVPSNDDGTWRRLEAVPFISRFVKSNEVDESNHRYLIDRQLKNKLGKWKEIMMLNMLEAWTKYDEEGIKVPDEVKNMTQEYRNKNDVVGQWISEICATKDHVMGEKCKLAPSSFEELYDAFKMWINMEEIVKHRVPTKQTFKEALFKWQHKSEWGLSLGSSKSDLKANGTKAYPLFNLVIK